MRLCLGMMLNVAINSILLAFLAPGNVGLNSVARIPDLTVPGVSPVERHEAGKSDMSNLSNSLDRKKNMMKAGMWGGMHVGLEITDDGARVEFDCAHSVINQRIILDRRGRFDVTGTHFEEHGGPTRESEASGSVPARFTGYVRDGKMKLTVRRADTRTLIGTYTLVRGQEPFIVKCR